MIIKRVSEKSSFLTAKQKIAALMYWPLRPEKPATLSAKTSQDRVPQSLYSTPDGEKGTKGGVQ